MAEAAFPVLFVSHGSPMHAIMPSAAASAWAEMVADLPRPRAVLMVSAHWETEIPLLGGAAQPETIYDFRGFAEALYALQYPVSGAPDIARQVLDILRESGFMAGIDGCRGIDHGAWVPMLKMYPQADVPMLQLSIQPDMGAAHHFQLGRALQGLQRAGVLIIGSGHMTHNLRDWIWRAGNSNIEQYAQEFRDWVDARVQTGNIDELLNWQARAPHAGRAHPTPDHFLPLFVALGAAGAGYRVEAAHTSYDNGVLAMDAYRFASAGN